MERQQHDSPPQSAGAQGSLVVHHLGPTKARFMSQPIINKTMARADLDSPRAREVIDELNALIVDLRARGLKISSWYGRFDLSGDPKSNEVINRGYGYSAVPGAVDDRNFPWFLYWEIAWVLCHADIRPGQRLLDLGGTSSLFSFYLASKGVDVVTVDLNPALKANADHVAKTMGWKLENHTMDMRDLQMQGEFDHITSICVFEHIPMFDRVDINTRVRDLLTPGGRFSITFDYRNPSRFARIDSPEDVEAQFVKPSQLAVRGNPEFADDGSSYLLHPFYSKQRLWRYKLRSVWRRHFAATEIARIKHVNDYTFGALFMEKP
jgi:2-polyprenyl-3-methyl-5-hydroxy-6-metoxy-1,4-benzoquinol methylase